MLKEIKFRAWQINHKVMCKVKNIHFNDNGDIESVTLLYPEGHTAQIITYSDSNERFWMHDKDGNCVLELMQYIGLWDKKGKEIYEGDIVKTNGYKSTALIEFDYLGATKKVMTPKGERNYRMFSDGEIIKGVLDDVEVIGNIYESPELLKQVVRWR